MFIKRVGYILFFTVLISGCARNPSKESGLVRFDYMAYTNYKNTTAMTHGPRASIVSITGDNGKEVFNEKKRSFSTQSILLPAGQYKVILVCGMGNYSDSRSSSYWKDKFLEQTVNTVPGDYIDIYVKNTGQGRIVKIQNPYNRSKYNLRPTYIEGCNVRLLVRHAK